MPKVFDVGFKRRGPGRIKWIEAQADTEKEALEKARLLISERYPASNLLLYAGPLERKTNT